MKAKLFFIILLCCSFLACTKSTNPSIEGTWQPLKIKWTFLDSSLIEYPGNVSQCEGIWMISQNYFSFAVNLKMAQDTSVMLDFLCGPFSFDGETYQETYQYGTPNNKTRLGHTFSHKLNISNDTLTIIGPKEDEVEKLGCRIYEVWIRKKTD